MEKLDSMAPLIIDSLQDPERTYAALVRVGNDRMDQLD
jgi:hypothetical protein